MATKTINSRYTDLTELNKLEAWLAENGFHYERIDNEEAPDKFGFSEVLERHQIIVYDNNGNRSFDAICHWGSYGHEAGLLEIYGTIVPADAGDYVEGWLSADDVIERIYNAIEANEQKGRKRKMANGNIYMKEITEPGESVELYQELDQIRLVFEPDEAGCPKLVGWYRP